MKDNAKKKAASRKTDAPESDAPKPEKPEPGAPDPNTPERTARVSYRTILMLILLVALLMRIVHGISTWQDNPRVRDLSADALYYDTWAAHIVEGTEGIEKPLYLPPLYPCILAVVRFVSGATLPQMIFIQALLGLLNLWMLHRITRNLFNEKAALFALMPALFYAPFLFYETRLMGTTLTLTLGLLSVMLIERALAKRTIPAFVMAGLCIGVLCELRPNFLLFGALATGLVFLVVKKPMLIRLKSAGLLALGVFIPLVFSLAYNVSTTNDWILVTSNGGINFYFGNHAKASGINDAPSRDFSSIFDQKATAKRLAETAVGKPLTQSEVSDYWYQKGKDRVMDDPGGWFRLVFKKLKLFLSSFGYGVIYVPEVEQHLSFVLSCQVFPAGLLLALGLGGIWLARKNGFMRFLPLLLFLATNLATVLLFFMAERFRMPFLIGILPFAGFFLATRFDHLKKRSHANWITGAIVTAALTVASFFMIDDEIQRGQSSRARISLAAAFTKEGMFDEARDEAEEALKIRKTPAALYHLGLIEEAAGNTIEAVIHYEEASLLDPTYLEPLGNLAMIYEQDKAWDKAIALRARTIEIVPYRYEGYYNMAMTCIDAGRRRDAVKNLKKATERAPGQAAVWEMLANAFHAAGDRDLAISTMQQALTIDPALDGARETIETWKNEGEKD